MASPGGSELRRNSDRDEGIPECVKSGAVGHGWGWSFKAGALVSPTQVQVLRWHSWGTLRKLSRKGQGAGGQLHLEAERERENQIWRESGSQVSPC